VLKSERYNDPWQLYEPTDAAEEIAYNNALFELEEGWKRARTMDTELAARRYMEAIMRKHANAGAYDSEGFQELERRIEKRKTEW
jgi:hypothetical protein